MTKFNNVITSSGRPLLVVAAVLSIAACAQDEGPDYCRDHHRIHAAHRDSVATLEISLSDDGALNGELNLPAAIGAPESVSEAFALKAGANCSVRESAVRRVADRLQTTYATDCGSEAHLRQIEVSIFDGLPDLDELEVTMATPVTRKRFVISGRCDRPIFRLD